MALSMRPGLTVTTSVLLLLSMASPAMAGTTTYTYDAQGQVKTVVRSNQTVTYSYDAAGNRAALSASAPLVGRAVAQGAERTLPTLPQLLNAPPPASSTKP